MSLYFTLCHFMSHEMIVRKGVKYLRLSCAGWREFLPVVSFFPQSTDTAGPHGHIMSRVLGHRCSLFSEWAGVSFWDYGIFLCVQMCTNVFKSGHILLNEHSKTPWIILACLLLIKIGNGWYIDGKTNTMRKQETLNSLLFYPPFSGGFHIDPITS